MQTSTPPTSDLLPNLTSEHTEHTEINHRNLHVLRTQQLFEKKQRSMNIKQKPVVCKDYTVFRPQLRQFTQSISFILPPFIRQTLFTETYILKIQIYRWLVHLLFDYEKRVLQRHIYKRNTFRSPQRSRKQL